MTTFTRIPESETPTISVDVGRRLSKIDPMIYGGFMEHMGRCIYGGIYSPGHPFADDHGHRSDVLEALRELEIPVIRYPGGNFCATYHWQDGIGPREKRPARPELAWLGVETNQFGTDEFMHFLSVLSAGREKRVEPYLCFNFGTGTLDEALAWVEYCNGTRDTYYANLRRKNGHEEPYNVKYWALGNEMWGPWQISQMTATEYSARATQWAKALLLMDPSIHLVLCGETGHSPWDHTALQSCIPYISMHSIHIYTSATTHLANVTAPLSAEHAITTAAALISIAYITHYSTPAPTFSPCPSLPSTRHPLPKICFDEWNVWDPLRAPGPKGAEQIYTLSDALAVAVWLNVFVRQSEHLGMANVAQSVNVISPLMTNERGVVRQTTWWVLKLFGQWMRGWTLGVHVRGEVWVVGKTKPEEDGRREEKDPKHEEEEEMSPAWLQGIKGGETSWLDVSACVDEHGTVSVVVVNVHEERDFAVRMDFRSALDDGDGKGEAKNDNPRKKIHIFTVTGPSIHAVNVEGKQEVGVQESEWDGEGRYVFPRHAMVMMRWETR